MSDKIKPGNIKTYRGNLSLDWYGKDYAIVQGSESDSAPGMVPPPALNWVNKDGALFYEIDESQGKGVRPIWVKRGDIRVHEARPLVHVKTYTAKPKKEEGSLGLEGSGGWEVVESDTAPENPLAGNLLIKGDNLLALSTLKQMFARRPDNEKVKCIYIDPPYNTGSAFERYDDNLERSEWLGMIRDRLIVLKSFLDVNGAIFVEIDMGFLSSLCEMMNEIFGRENLITIVTIKRSAATGHKSINPSPVNTTDYVLGYARDKSQWEYIPQYVERGIDSAYNKYIENFDNGMDCWNFITLNEASKKYSLTQEELTMKRPERVIRFAEPSYEGVGEETRGLIDESKQNPKRIFIQKREKHKDIILLNGQRILFYKDKLREINGKLVTGDLMTNFWDDIPFQGIAGEGDVEFPKSKKPEKLVRRIIEMSTCKDDIVLDCFAGSGSTLAVASKLQRRWIGIEVGNQAEDLDVKRLCKVIGGTDSTGISKVVNWTGGGSFAFYRLGDSILKADVEGYADLNWAAGRAWLEGAILSAYDFKALDPISGGLGFDNVSLGLRSERKIKDVALVSLYAPGEPESRQMLGRREWEGLWAVARKFGVKVFLFTNRGLELAADSKPDNLVVVRIPEALCTAD